MGLPFKRARYKVKKLFSGNKAFQAECLNRLQQLEERQTALQSELTELRQGLSSLQAELGPSLKKKIISTDASLKAHPELGLMAHLYSFLSTGSAIDIGANVGDVSNHLLNSGYRIHAFEPNPPVFQKLKSRLEKRPHFVAHPCAVGSADKTMTLHLAADLSGGRYEDSTLYSTLLPHAMSTDLVFSSTVDVPVRSLASLHQSGELPPNIDLVKIDTEGFDIEVIRGMGEHRYPVVAAEFWDEKFMFGKSPTLNKLVDLVDEMRARDYYWFIVIYRIEGSYDVAFYSNHKHSIEKSWGNIFFFQDHSIFSGALEWCSAVVPETVFEG